MRGRKPKPVRNQFSRPGITLDRQSRSWQEVSPLQLDEGDLIPDFGKIVVVSHRSREFDLLSLSDVMWVKVEFLSGATHSFRSDEKVKAFTTGISPWHDDGAAEVMVRA